MWFHVSDALMDALVISRLDTLGSLANLDPCTWRWSWSEPRLGVKLGYFCPCCPMTAGCKRTTTSLWHLSVPLIHCKCFHVEPCTNGDNHKRCTG